MRRGALRRAPGSPAAARREAGRQVRVMMLPNTSHPGGNPFVGLLVESLERDIETLPFRWRSAFAADYDVLHLHWPEYLLRADRRWERAARAAALRMLMVRLRSARLPWIVTMHNLEPHHDLDRRAHRLIDALIRTADVRVFMNDHDVVSPAFEEGDVVVHHGDYSSAVAAFAESLEEVRPSPGRLLVFGGIQPYKGIERVVDAVRSSSSLQLEIRGRATDAEYAERIVRAAADEPRIVVDVGELEERVLARHIRRAHAVVLPYADLYNSGAAMLALTLGTPIVVLNSRTARELHDEFGPSRVVVLESITSAALEAALTSLPPGERPIGPLTRKRRWRHLGATYSSLFRSRATVSARVLRGAA